MIIMSRRVYNPLTTEESHEQPQHFRRYSLDQQHNFWRASTLRKTVQAIGALQHCGWNTGGHLG
jgi:hypothetical protein